MEITSPLRRAVETMKRKIALVAAVSIMSVLLICACIAAQPQSAPEEPQAPQSEPNGAPSESRGASDRIPQAAPTIQLSLSTSTVNFGDGTLQPRSAPYTQPMTARVNANARWRISVSKDTDLRGVSNSIPSGNLTFSAAGPPGKTTYAAPPGTQFGTNTRVVEGTRGNNLTTTITYNLVVPWELEPDTYTATHTYTALLM